MSEAGSTETQIAEAKGKASVAPVKVAEMREVLDRIAADDLGFAARHIDYWNAGVPSTDVMRRIVVLEATIRFLSLCEENSEAIKKIISKKR